MKTIENRTDALEKRVSILEKKDINQDTQIANQNLDNVQTQITDLQNQITDLENKLQNVGGAEQKNVGTSVAEISALMNDFLGEDDFCTAASEKLQFGALCKVEYAPHARIFFRHNPLKTLAPTITLGFWLSPLPSGITNLPATITLNSTTIFDGNLEITATSGKVAQITLPINRAQCPMQVFNVLEVSFNDDTNFASTFLDWIEVEITQSQNCIILNRSTDHEIYGIKRTSGAHRVFDTRYKGAGLYKWGGNDSAAVTDDKILLLSFKIQKINGISPKSRKLYIQHCYNLNNDQKFNFILSDNLEYIITQDNIFYAYSGLIAKSSFEELKYSVANVLYAKPSLHNGEGHITNLCCVHQDFSINVYRADLYSFYYLNFLEKFDFLFNNEQYPNEFIDFIPVKDAYASFRIGYQSCGYFLLHQSGNILFVPSMNSPYFITLGKGRQVNAFLGEDGNSIIVIYQYNKSFFKKILNRENISSVWKLTEEYEFFLDIQELWIIADKTFALSNETLYLI